MFAHITICMYMYINVCTYVSQGRLQFFLPGCVSMGFENRPILKGLNDDNLDPYLRDLCFL